MCGEGIKVGNQILYSGQALHIQSCTNGLSFTSLASNTKLGIEGTS
jgi:hypothetical protein